jgi:hypothetical protein
MSKVTLDFIPGRERRGFWGCKDEEFAADFCLVSKRTLPDLEYRIFKYHSFPAAIGSCAAAAELGSRQFLSRRVSDRAEARPRLFASSSLIPSFQSTTTSTAQQKHHQRDAAPSPHPASAAQLDAGPEREDRVNRSFITQTGI